MTLHDVSSLAWEPLIEAAWKAREHAHAPYSRFKVGAALQLVNGAIAVGCNVENAAYPLTVCAERNAIAEAVARHGLKPGDLKAVVVVTDVEDLTPPCGACRQVLVEFAEDIPVLLANRTQRELHHLAALLPHSFSGRNFLPLPPAR